VLKKIDKYYQTLRYLKKSQIKYLVKNRLERGRAAVTEAAAPACAELPLWMPDLDMQGDYLQRFFLEEILEGRVTLLHESGEPSGKNWANPDKSHLWNFNLHYLEFLIPLAAAYQNSRDMRYYECFRDYCSRWIADNQEGTGDGWHPYTISLRLTNLWICMDGFGEALGEDAGFLKKLNNSMYAQYLHLQKKLELHLLGNHYFENLKAVVLGSLYFQEPEIYQQYRKKLREEIAEQILPDGVHYERSLMYHKIILEDVMRVAKAVKNTDKEWYGELSLTMQKMADAVWSLEEGMGHTPLFNDAGDNVARPLDGLLDALREEFQITPDRAGKKAFPNAGYYCLGNAGIKILMDAGEIAPDYMPGHGHCDGLSFELAYRGSTVFANSGTGQYQGPLRSYFRSTAAHNTVLIDGQEQSECWGEHRVGKRITNVSGSCGDTWVEGSLTTCFGKRQKRRIELKENMAEILDTVEGQAKAYFHLDSEYEYIPQRFSILVRSRKEEVTICEIRVPYGDGVTFYTGGDISSYAPKFGEIRQTQVLEVAWDGEGTEHGIQIKFL